MCIRDRCAQIQELQIKLNTTAAKEHVGTAERAIRTVKERSRAVRHTLPFKRLPLIMLIEMVYFCVLWLNAFPAKRGVSDAISPQEIMSGHKLDYNKHCKLPFGAYMQAHEEPTPSNSQQARTVGAICLGPTENIQGSYKFLNLHTGWKIT